MSRARTLWQSQCGVVPSIREKYGLQAALDYLVSEKLLTFAEAATSHPDFAQELPVFVAEIRRLFTPERSGSISRSWCPGPKKLPEPMPRRTRMTSRRSRPSSSTPGWGG